MSSLTELTGIAGDILNRLNDTANGDRFVELFSGKLLYVPALKQWFYWDEMRWHKDEFGEHVHEATRVVCDHILTECKDFQRNALALIEQAANDDEESEVERIYDSTLKKIMSFAYQSQNSARVSAMAKLVARSAKMSIASEKLDANGGIIGVRNGILDLDTQELITDPAHIVTRTIAAEYDATATCPHWLQFIHDITGGDEQLAEYLQRVAGNCLLGTTKGRVIILHGVTGTRKTTFTEALRTLLGDYGTTVPVKKLLGDNQYSNTDYYLIGLKGARMVSLHETEGDEQAIAGDVIKQLVRSGKVKARNIREKVTEFLPVFTPILTTNHMPRIGADGAVWSRIVVVPFEQALPVTQQDLEFIEHTVLPELSGIFNWCLQGLRLYRENGLEPPPKIAEYTQKAWDEQDKLKQFIEQYCDYDATGVMTLRTFREAYHRSCKDSGHKRPESSTMIHRYFDAKEQQGDRRVVVRSKSSQHYVHGLKRKGK
jgi:putative DNA primase/helicase